MKYEELAAVSARYTVAHREMISVINDAVGLAELDKASKNNDEVQEILSAYSQTRTRLIDSLLWFRYLHQTLVARTDEARKAAREYLEKLEQSKKAEEEKAAAGPEEVPQVPEEPVKSDDAQEGGAPCLKLL